MAEEPGTIAGAATALGNTLMTSLPAQFLGLVALNVCFLASAIWFLDRQNTARERMLTPIISKCMQEVPLEVVEKLVDLRK